MDFIFSVELIKKKFIVVYSVYSVSLIHYIILSANYTLGILSDYHQALNSVKITRVLITLLTYGVRIRQR